MNQEAKMTKSFNKNKAKIEIERLKKKLKTAPYAYRVSIANFQISS